MSSPPYHCIPWPMPTVAATVCVGTAVASQPMGSMLMTASGPTHHLCAVAHSTRVATRDRQEFGELPERCRHPTVGLGHGFTLGARAGSYQGLSAHDLLAARQPESWSTELWREPLHSGAHFEEGDDAGSSVT